MKIFLTALLTALLGSACKNSSSDPAVSEDDGGAQNPGIDTSTMVVVAPENLESSSLDSSDVLALFAGVATSTSFVSDGGDVDSYTIEPALPTGLNLDSETGVISGTIPYLISGGSFTLTATNDAGSTTKAFTIEISSRFDGDITLVTEITDNPANNGASATTINYMTNSLDFAVSHDNRNIYITSDDANALTVMDLNPDTGAVSFNEEHVDGAVSTELQGAAGVVVSPDDRFVYVAGRFDQGIAVYSRNTSNGKLTHIQDVQEGVSSVNGLNLPSGFNLSPDGKFLWVGTNNNNMLYFSRDATTGLLTFERNIFNNDLDGNTTAIVNVNNVQGFAFTNDSRFVYYSSADNDSVGLLSQDPTTGEVLFQDTYVHANGSFQDDAGVTITNMQAPKRMSVSPDNRHLYVAAGDSNSIVVFSINPSTGGLTMVDSYLETGVDAAGTTITNYQDSRSSFVSPDGAFVLGQAATTGSFILFSRNFTTGELTMAGTPYDDGSNNQDSQGATLNQLTAMRHAGWSPDGQYFFLFATGSTDAMTVIKMNTK